MATIQKKQAAQNPKPEVPKDPIRGPVESMIKLSAVQEKLEGLSSVFKP